MAANNRHILGPLKFSPYMKCVVIRQRSLASNSSMQNGSERTAAIAIQRFQVPRERGALRSLESIFVNHRSKTPFVGPIIPNSGLLRADVQGWQEILYRPNAWPAMTLPIQNIIDMHKTISLFLMPPSATTPAG